MDLSKECPGLFHELRGISPDGSGTALAQIVSFALYNKHKVCEDFQLTDGRVFFANTEERDSLLPVSTKLMMDMLGGTCTIEEVQLNKKNDTGEKISRMFLKQFNTQEDLQKSPAFAPFILTLLSKKSDLMRELPKFNPMREEHVDRYWEDPPMDPLQQFAATNMLELLQLFVQNYYSEISGLIKVRLMFSVNPLDIFNAANSKVFTSCFKMGGMYPKGSFIVNSILNSGVISAVSESNNCIGRAWVYWKEDYKHWAVIRPFGTLNTEAIDFVMGSLLGRNEITASQSWTRLISTRASDKGSFDSSNIFPGIVTSGFYFDMVHCAYTTNQKELVIPLQETSVPCILCGKHTCGNKNIFCSDCIKTRVNYCKKCNKPMLDGRLLCADCNTDSVICPICGTEHGIKMACPGCYRKTHCLFCGSEDVATVVDKDAVCKNCAEILQSTTCDFCSNKHGIPVQPVLIGNTVFRMCPTCAVENLHRNSTESYLKDKKRAQDARVSHLPVRTDVSVKHKKKGR